MLSGRRVSRALGSDPNILVLDSDEFWERVSGIADFRARLIRTTAILSGLITARAASEVARIREDAHEISGMPRATSILPSSRIHPRGLVGAVRKRCVKTGAGRLSSAEGLGSLARKRP